MTQGPRLGVDLGGTKIEAIVLGDAGEISHRLRVPTPGNYHDTLKAIAALIDDITQAAGIDTPLPLGIGTPGAISLKSGKMKNCNSTFLNGQSLLEDLASLLSRPVRIANDADCMTLSEATDGAGAGEPLVFGVILGTGVGGGLCHQGALLHGPNAITGEWGHNPLPLAACQGNWQPVAGERNCYCGRTDCVETWLSGPAFERSYKELTGQSASARDIAAKAIKGDGPEALMLDRYANLLALALGNVINIVDPDVIVLAGGMSNIPRLPELVSQRLPDYVFSDMVTTRISKARHGDSSGVRGAAWLWGQSKVPE